MSSVGVFEGYDPEQTAIFISAILVDPQQEPFKRMDILQRKRARDYYRNKVITMAYNYYRTVY